MLYRHVQPLFLSSDYSTDSLRGPTMRVRPLDTDAPDHLLRFVFWAAIHVREPDLTAAVSVPPDPEKKEEEVVVTARRRPKLLIEMSVDGEGWVVQSTLEPRERPYLVTVAHMLQHVRVRLEPGGAETRGHALVMANGPFALDGRSVLVGPGGQPGGGRR